MTDPNSCPFCGECPCCCEQREQEMKLDLKKLEQLAIDCKSVESVYCVACVEDETGQKCKCLACLWENEANPETMLALLDYVKKLEAVREAANAVGYSWSLANYPNPNLIAPMEFMRRAIEACEGGSDE